MVKEVLRSLFDLNAQVIYINLEGVSHEESLEEPSKGGNGINWILGHVVANRNGILRSVGEHSIWDREEIRLYQRGSPPLNHAPDAMPLEKILADFTESQNRLMAALDLMDDTSLTAEKGERGKSPSEALTLLAFHEAYHAGQIGLLRRMVGKDGAIR